MDTLSLETLETFLPDKPGWHISMFMPVFRAGRETEQNPIRFKNLLQEAENRLLAKDLRAPDVRKFLAPARKLLDEPGFWRKQSDGLAVLLSQDTFEYYRLPLSFEELVVISENFHLKPLLPLFASDGHFYILALSQNQVRLMEGTRSTVDVIDLEGLPQSMAEAFQLDRLNRNVQFHTSTSTGGAGDRAAAHHGHDPSDEEKKQILKWFQKIDAELPQLLVGEGSPLVLAGVERLFPLYHQANSYPHLVEEGIPGNPEEEKPEALHAQAWPIVQPEFMQAQEKAAAQYHQLTDSGQATSNLQDAVAAAHQGRVSDLFVALDVQIWGSFEPETYQVQVHPEVEQGDRDLLDLAAIQTMLTGGTVYAVEQAQVPDQGFLAAVFRY